ncbi:unnamed protein product, partial [marine sediment metagenome]
QLERQRGQKEQIEKSITLSQQEIKEQKRNLRRREQAR